MKLPNVRPQTDYLYERRGPWPQPLPSHPFGLAPAVVHVPENEIRRWKWRIGLRYLITFLTFWFWAAIYAFKNRSLLPVSDAEFEELLTHSSLSKFLSNELNERDKYPNNEKLEIFKEFLDKNPDEKFYVVDFSLLTKLKPYPGMYAVPTMSLFKGDLVEGKRKVVAVYLYDTKQMFTPEDGNAWELVKYFALQSGAIRISSSAHANLHFPYDSINAVSKSSLPKDSVLLRLLLPHLDLTLELNYSVLNSGTSPILNKQYLPFSAFPADADGLAGMFVDGYNGMEGNPSYPTYEFHAIPKDTFTDYGTFLFSYYDTILDFTNKVVAEIPASEYADIMVWIDYVRTWVLDFPDKNYFFDQEGKLIIKEVDTPSNKQVYVIAEVVANIIWDLSVGHAADHYDYSNININKAPLRLRVPPPTSKNIPPLDRRKLIHWVDLFKHHFERKMFFAPRNVTYLKDVHYNFHRPGEEKLRKLNEEFLKNLKKTEEKLTVYNYIPLHQITPSIQY
ncbi:MAG: hypothetical protein ABI761_14375 [Saprospiraceae bacterium]